MTDRRVLSDTRVLSDADIEALIDAMKQHETHCRFKTIEPNDLHDVMHFVRSFSSALEEGKSVVRKTLLVLLILDHPDGLPRGPRRAAHRAEERGEGHPQQITLERLAGGEHHQGA